MKRLFVTGASGFLGSRITAFFRETYTIYAPTHNEMNITNKESVTNILEKYRPDIVIHCAAISDVGFCEKEPEKSWEINVNGSINIAEAANKIHAKCILCSSDQVYFGSFQEEAHKEKEELCPIPLYGQQKLKAEQECLKVNPNCVLLRLSWLYDVRTFKEGEHGDFFRSLLSKIETSEVLTYPVYDKRGITDVKEVLKNIEKTFDIEGGVYNFGSFNDKNTYETVCEVFQKLGLDIERVTKNEKAFQENPRNITMYQKKAEKYGIVFPATIDSLAKNLDMVLNKRNIS